MITKPYSGGSGQSETRDGDVDVSNDELSSVNCCASLFIYDDVDRQLTSDVDASCYDCVTDDTSKPTELLYLPTQHHHQQQQCGGDGDGDVVKLQLLAGCGSKAPAPEYPWMREKKCASDAMCLSTSLSDRRLRQCLTSDPFTQTNPGLSVLV